MDEMDIRLMLRSALPLEDVDQVCVFGGGSTPVMVILVWIDIGDRPDLADLASRHGKEGGYSLIHWFAADPGKQRMIIGLRVELRQPARAVFHLAFRVEKYLVELEMLAQSGQLWIIPGPPPAGLTGISLKSPADLIAIGSRGLVLELEPSQLSYLRDQLSAWKRR